MKPSDALRTRSNALRVAVLRFRVANPRVFGSVLHGTDRDGSDLDLLVDPPPETTLLDLGGLQVALEELLGVPVDVRTPGDLPVRFRDAVLREAQPLLSINRFTDWLGDMRAAAQQACDYVEDMTREAFAADPRTQQAVAMNLLIMGEIAAKLIDQHPEQLAAHPQVPWASMKGMRNRIAHGYFDIDQGVVWETVQRALPGLIEHLTALLPESGGSASPR